MAVSAESLSVTSLEKELRPSPLILALLDRYTLDVHTPKFAGSFKKLEFYQNPKDPTLKEVVATLEFTHSVDLAELQKNLALSMIAGSPVLKQGVPPFSVDFGMHHRIAYIHSAPFTDPATSCTWALS